MVLIFVLSARVIRTERSITWEGVRNCAHHSRIDTASFVTGEELRTQFGRRIRAIRRSRDVTQEKLAEYCDLSPEYISHIERGKASPSFDVIAGLSEELGVEPKALFDFTGLEERS